MRYYETIFIVNPDIADDDYQAVLAKAGDVIEKQKGVVVKVQEWGKQKLAYPIKRFPKGSYVVLNYCGNAGVSSELERALRLDERVLKHLTVKLEQDADPEELLRREETKAGEASAPETAVEGEQEGESETETPSSTGEGEDEGEDNV